MTWRPRALFYIDHFWPTISTAQVAAAQTACALNERGAEVTLVTAQGDPGWPTDFVYRNLSVHRVPWPWHGAWRIQRFRRRLHNFIKHHLTTRAHVAQLVAWGNSPEIISLKRLSSQFAQRLIVVVGSELASFHESGNPLPRTIINQLAEPSDILVTCPTIWDWLQSHAAIAPRVTYLPPILRYPDDLPEVGTVPQARKSLGRLHPLFDVEPDQPVALTIWPFAGDPGIDDLLTVWARVVRAVPTARLWIVGHGPDWTRVVRRAADLGLERSVAFPGVFDDWQDVASAANVFIYPGRWRGDNLALKQMLAYGCCAIATRAWDDRSLSFGESMGETRAATTDAELCERSRQAPPVIRVASINSEEGFNAIVSLMGDTRQAKTLGEQGRKWLDSHWSSEMVARAWWRALYGLSTQNTTAT